MCEVSWRNDSRSIVEKVHKVDGIKKTCLKQCVSFLPRMPQMSFLGGASHGSRTIEQVCWPKILEVFELDYYLFPSWRWRGLTVFRRGRLSWNHWARRRGRWRWAPSSRRCSRTRQMPGEIMQLVSVCACACQSGGGKHTPYGKCAEKIEFWVSQGINFRHPSLSLHA